MKTNIEMAKQDLKRKCGYSYTLEKIRQSELFSALDSLSRKNEDEINKVDLYNLIKKCCDYMRAHNISEYYRREYQKLMFGDSEDGNINDKNG